jgi:hypothetical protein
VGKAVTSVTLLITKSLNGYIFGNATVTAGYIFVNFLKLRPRPVVVLEEETERTEAQGHGSWLTGGRTRNIRQVLYSAMKLLVIADEDSFIKTLMNDYADVLISCGDLEDQVILKTAQIAQCSRIFAVKGNHDGSGAFPDPILDLHLRAESFGGLTFGGFRGAWRYKPKGHFLYDEDEVKSFVEKFPPVDIFIAHNSPRHTHDRDDDVHLGFEAFVGYIRRAQPRFFFHGHQHINQQTQVGKTRVIGIYGLQKFEIQAR